MGNRTCRKGGPVNFRPGDDRRVPSITHRRGRPGRSGCRPFRRSPRRSRAGMPRSCRSCRRSRRRLADLKKGAGSWPCLSVRAKGKVLKAGRGFDLRPDRITTGKPSSRRAFFTHWRANTKASGHQVAVVALRWLATTVETMPHCNTRPAADPKADRRPIRSNRELLRCRRVAGKR